MPHHKSAAKRVITNARARERNVAMKTRVRGALKAVRQAADPAAASRALRDAASVLDRAVAKGILKRATADRHKSRLALHVRKPSPAS